MTSASRSAWYWHRLRAMDLAEVAGRLRRVCRRIAGEPSARQFDAWSAVTATGPFPALPDREQAPERVRHAVAAAADEVLSGRWRPFGGLDLDIDDPPRWQRDALACVDLTTQQPAAGLDPRRPPSGADARVIWELSRWDPLVRLAQAAWLLDRRDDGALALRWLEHWARENPPYRGWNWTSALESGLRLIQLCWIDAWLSRALRDATERDRLERAVRGIFPAHFWFTWHQRSFGSSANNHLLGELAGLLVAAVRWPAIDRAAAPIDLLHRAWERAVLAQFAADGGNREQALHYHLFGFELSWQAAAALDAAGRAIAPAVRERIARAASFYATVQVESEPWDYGDSDDATVTRFHAGDLDTRVEWRGWMRGEDAGDAVAYWLGPSPHELRPGPWPADGCTLFPESGIAVWRWSGWTLRFDASPLGYLATAAHGHLDALHLSLWLDGAAIVIDPGTGTYYADPRLRESLASRQSHNGPCPVGLDRPRRLGAFLWSQPHDQPAFGRRAGGELEASLTTPLGMLRRSVRPRPEDGAWSVADRCEGGHDFRVTWQLAPGAAVERAGDRAWRVGRGAASVVIEAEGPWAEGAIGTATVSPSFRVVTEAPCLVLRAGEAAASGALCTNFRRA